MMLGVTIQSRLIITVSVQSIPSVTEAITTIPKQDFTTSKLVTTILKSADLSLLIARNTLIPNLSTD